MPLRQTCRTIFSLLFLSIINSGINQALATPIVASQNSVQGSQSQLITKTNLINPSDAESYYNRGVLRFQKGQIDLAIADFTQVITLDPNHVDAHYNRGLLYSQQGQTSLAIADFTQVITLNPNDINAYHDRGIVYFKQGQIDLAIADFTQVITLNPNHPLRLS